MPGDSDLEIEEAFRRAQKAHNNKAKLVASLKNRYNKVTYRRFTHNDTLPFKILGSFFFFFFFKCI